MDLAICQPYLAYGGVEKVILKLAERFNPVIYLSQYDKGSTWRAFSEFDIRILPHHALELPLRAFSGLDKDARTTSLGVSALKFLDFKIKDDYDVLNPHLLPSHWARNHNARVCWYCHCPCRPAYGWTDYYMAERGLAGRFALRASIASYTHFEEKIVPKIESICTNSDFTRKNIEKYHKREDAIVAHPGVGAKDYSTTGFSKFFLYNSRFVPEKNMEFAIRAFRRFSRKGWKLVICGHLPSEKRNKDYLEFLKNEARGINVEFKPNISDAVLKSLYADCYCALFAAIKEDWGIVPLEEMASGKPVISIKQGGPCESILDGKTGFLVDSIDKMAEKMRHLADHPDICEQMGKEGRKRVEQNYTWKIFLDKMENAFKKTAKM